MSGLLDVFNSDQGRLGLSLLAAAGPRMDGAGFGARLQEAMGSMDAYKKQQMMAQIQKMQMENAQADMADKQAQRAQAQQMQELYKRFATPAQAAVPSIQGDTESGILPSQGQAAKPAGYDYQGLAGALAGINPMAALDLQQKLVKQGPKFATEPRYDQQGRAFILAEDGSMKYLDGVKARDKLVETDLGGKKGFRSEYSPELVGSLDKTVNPDTVYSGGVTMRGQNMTDARARDMQRFTAEQAGKPQFHDGQWVMPPSASNPQGVATPVAGYQKPLDVSQKKQLAGIESLNGAIGEYVNNLQNWNKLGALSPDARAEMGTKYNNMMLQAKEAYNLGVLNGPDFQILQSVVTDPRSLTGAFTSKKALEKQATELGRIMSTVTAPAVRGGGVGAESGVKPVAGKVPMKGQTVDGYKFKGGNPADPNNWERQ